MPYNVMCSASGQVINAGNPCRAVALVRQSSWKPVEIVHRDKTLEVFGPGDHNTHPGSNWSPGSAHFPRAPYNEYGGLYLDVDYGTDEEWAERWLMVKSILAGMPDVLPGDNTVHDIGFVKSEFFEHEAPLLKGFEPGKDPLTPEIREQIKAAWDKVWELAHEGRLFTQTTNGQFAPVKFGLMHEAAYDGLIDIAETTRTFYDPIPLERFVKEALDEVMEGVQACQDADPSRRAIAIWKAHEELASNLQKAAGQNDSTLARLMQVAVTAYADSGDAMALEKAVLNGSKAAYLMAGMDLVGQSFAPMRYAGDDFENQAGRLFEGLVSETRRVVDRAQHEQQWGPYQAYTLAVESESDARDLIAELCADWDCHGQILSLTAGPDGSTTMQFEATMGPDHFAEFEGYVRDEFYAGEAPSRQRES